MPIQKYYLLLNQQALIMILKILSKIFNDMMDVWLFKYDGEVDLGNATKDEVIQVTWMKREQIKELFEHKVLMRAIARHERLILLNMAIKPLG